MNAEPLSDAAIDAALETLPGWSRAGDGLAKEFVLADFRAALAFMVRVGFEAEARNHHPEWSNVYHRVSIRLSTHDAGGKITARDVDLATAIEAVQPAALT